MISKNPSLKKLQTIERLFSEKDYRSAKKNVELMLSDFPDSDILFATLGLCDIRLKDYESASYALRVARKLGSKRPEIQYQSGIAMMGMEKTEEAIYFFENAVHSGLENYDCYYRLSRCLVTLGHLQKALSWIKCAIILDQSRPEAFNQLGVIYLSLELWEKAKPCFERAISCDQASSSIALSNLALTMAMLKMPAQAVKYAEQAIAMDSKDIWAYNNLGIMYDQLGESYKALEVFEKALSLDATFAEAHNHIGGTYLNLGQHHQAINSYERALNINPHYFDAYNNRNLAMNYCCSNDPVRTFERHCEFDSLFESPSRKWDEYREFDGLRIGYVSGDFRKHSVSYFLEPVLRHHNGEKMQIYCYHNSRHSDEVTERLKKYAHEWREIFDASDDSLVDQIIDDKIDILVDLSGHTKGNRLPVFAKRPAPVQVSWLGYPNTTGLSAIDYRITDEHTDPLTISDPYYSERLFRLKEGFLCYQGDTSVPTTADPPVLKNENITFGSFNNSNKITDDVVAIWCDILRAVPNSSLLLKSHHFQSRDLRELLLQKFDNLGVSENAVRLESRIENSRKHLEFYSNIDIALDPFPYNGTTTTCEALWMGVPVVTVAGETHASRVSSGILKQINMDSLIAPSIKDYASTAVQLANDHIELCRLRRTLRERMIQSPLCDASNFTEALESAYETMWNHYIEYRET